MSQFVFPLARALTAGLLGIGPEHTPRLGTLLRPGVTFAFYQGERLVRYPSVVVPNPEVPRKWRLELREFISTILTGPPSSLPPGALRGLKHACEGGRLSMTEAVMLGVELTFASFEPLAYQLGNVLQALRTEPQLLNRLANDAARLSDAVVELVRYDCAVQAVFRYAASDHTIHGQSIRAGDQVVLLLGAANRDPRQFDRPNEIDIDRPRQSELAFGKGEHACLGRTLVKTMLERILGALLSQYPSIEPAGHIRWSSDLPMRGPLSLPCTLSSGIKNATSASEYFD